ncbi:MAG: LysM peptidoglycan-binding domain-containing protein, partial [Bacteroidales bacterium]|nr:LysM peptidoglycan-binding domain-containing protein [Bacteroidales bacterium]
GNVNKAIRRAGGKSNYWDIYYYLPRETRGHIPAFIAATYIMNYYEEHNIEPRELKDLPLTCDTIQVNEKLHLEQVSKVLQLPMKQLRDLNPQYRYDIIPASKSKTYALRLPTDHALTFIDSSKAIFAYKDSIYFKNNTITKPVKSYRTPSAPGSNYTKLTYKVKANDNLGFISEWYDVRISDIRYWNNIRGNMIRSGQKLAIYKKKSVASKYSDIDKLSFAQKQARIGKQVKSSSKPKAPPAEPLKEGEYVVYTVKRGDTFWDIAKLYNVTDTQIMRWNSITNAKSLREGQKLKIKKVN